jgi:polymorphic membrane protein
MKIKIAHDIKTVIGLMLFFAVVIGLHAETITVTTTDDTGRPGSSKLRPRPTPRARPTPQPGPAQTIIVINTNDSGPGSLRQALAGSSDGDTIDFAVAGIIELNSGELVVNKSITISGPGSENLALDGKLESRVFHIGAGRTVMISGLTIRRGVANSGGGIYNDHAGLTISNCKFGPNQAIASGAGIYNNGEQGGGATLQIRDCTFSTNFSQGFGGGISNDGSLGGSATLEIDACGFDTNLAPSGGAIANVGDSGAATVEIHMSTFTTNFARDGAATYNRNATSTLDTCTIINNQAEGRGAAIYNNGTEKGTATLIVSNSTLMSNFANGESGSGGGIYNDGSSLGNANSQIIDSTLTFNSAIESGGAIYNDGQSSGHASLQIDNSTFSDNSAGLNSAGIYNLGANGGDATVDLANTILKAGGATDNIINDSGTVTSLGYNLSDDDAGGYLTGPGDQINTDPLLGPLQDNGGPTLTHELLSGSPAIDVGDPDFTSPPFYDQRGPDFFRVRNGRIDIGSFEVQVGSTPSPTPAPRPTPTPREHPAPHPRPTPL